jgi:diaminopimelate decarboxylase
VSVKKTRDGDFLIVDAAMNDLIRPTLYEAYHEVVPVRPVQADEQPVSYMIVGPICESGDTFAVGREMPVCKEGDLVLLASAGAYGFCMASNYNTRGLPAEILSAEGKFSLIRPRQSVEELYGNEYIPDWDALI